MSDVADGSAPHPGFFGLVPDKANFTSTWLNLVHIEFGIMNAFHPRCPGAFNCHYTESPAEGEEFLV